MIRKRNESRGTGGYRRCCLWPWAVAVLGFFNNKVRAGEGGLRLGIQPQPHLATTLSYDDNITAFRTNQLGDLSVTLSPGVSLAWGVPGRNNLVLDYTFEWERYFDHPKFDAANHRATLTAALASPQTTLQLAHTFAREAVIIVEAATRGEQEQNSTAFTLRRTLSQKTAWGVSYNQEFRDYSTPGLIGYREFVPGASFFYRVLPKTELLGEVAVGFVDVARGADALYEQVSIGLTGPFSPKIRGSVRVGYEHREYTSDQPATDSPVADVSLTAAFRERTGATLSLSYQPASSIIQANDTVQVLKVALDLHQKLCHDRVTVTAGTYYETSDYAVSGRLDQYWVTRTGLAYAWKRWAETGLNYEHENNQSSIGTVAFRRNLISWTVTAHF
jgi:hypothetical protein